MKNNFHAKLVLLVLISLVLGAPGVVLGQKSGKVNAGLKPAPPIEAKIERVWVDHNYRGGMRIHVKFGIEDARNVRCQAVAYFFFDSGEKLRTSRKQYRAAGGQLATGNLHWVTTGKNGSAEMTLFLPYREIPLPEGEHELKFLVQLSTDGIPADRSGTHRFSLRR